MADPMSVLRDFVENIQKDKPDLLINQYQEYVVPVYKYAEYKDADHIDFCGSSFFFKTDKNLFFITCAHVIRDCVNAKYQGVLIPFFKNDETFLDLLEISTASFTSNGFGARNDFVELFFAIVKQEYAEKLTEVYDFFCKKDCAEDIPNLHMPRKLTSIGFPWTRNKVKRNKLLKANLYTYTGNELEWYEINSLKDQETGKSLFSIADHILYRCKISNIQDESEFGPHKPKPEGISGGCIFDISENHPIKLAGMIFTRQMKPIGPGTYLFVGLSIQTILRCLDAYENGDLDENSL